MLDDGWPLGEALPLVSRNPAQRLGLRGKGRLAVGYDADVLLMDVRSGLGGILLMRRRRAHVPCAAFAARLSPLHFTDHETFLPSLPLDPGQPDTLALQYVLARGQLVKTPGWVRGGMFERGPGIRPFTPTLQTG